MVVVVRGELGMLAPALVQEPAPRVLYAARAGTALHCGARGDPPPRVSWLADDGSVLHEQPGLRYTPKIIYYNLIFIRVT